MIGILVMWVQRVQFWSKWLQIGFAMLTNRKLLGSKETSVWAVLHTVHRYIIDNMFFPAKFCQCRTNEWAPGKHWTFATDHRHLLVNVCLWSRAWHHKMNINTPQLGFLLSCWTGDSHMGPLRSSWPENITCQSMALSVITWSAHYILSHLHTHVLYTVAGVVSKLFILRCSPLQIWDTIFETPHVYKNWMTDVCVCDGKRLQELETNIQ